MRKNLLATAAVGLLGFTNIGGAFAADIPVNQVKIPADHQPTAKAPWDPGHAYFPLPCQELSAAMRATSKVTNGTNPVGGNPVDVVRGDAQLSQNCPVLTPTPSASAS